MINCFKSFLQFDLSGLKPEKITQYSNNIHFVKIIGLNLGNE